MRKFNVGDVVIIDHKPQPLVGIVGSRTSSVTGGRMWLHVNVMRDGELMSRIVMCSEHQVQPHPDPDRVHAEHAAWILVNGEPK